MTPVQLIEKCEQRGITLFAKPNGNIGYSAAPGLVTDTLLATLKQHKADLLPHLPDVELIEAKKLWMEIEAEWDEAEQAPTPAPDVEDDFGGFDQSDPEPASAKVEGPRRTICLVCGGDIAPGDESVSILTARYGVELDPGVAHRACHGASGGVCDVTGKPDFVGFNEDATKPAYVDRYDPVAAGERADRHARAYKERKGELYAAA